MPRAPRPAPPPVAKPRAAARKKAPAAAAAAPRAPGTQDEDAATAARLTAQDDAATAAGLTRTDIPGVYRSPRGATVDHLGVLLGFQALKLRYETHATQVIGHPARSPAEFLKLAAMDPRTPFADRVDAAKAAAPYYDRKMPLAVDGGADPNAPGGPGLPIQVASLKGLSDAELMTMQALLEKTSAGG